MVAAFTFKLNIYSVLCIDGKTHFNFQAVNKQTNIKELKNNSLYTFIWLFNQPSLSSTSNENNNNKSTEAQNNRLNKMYKGCYCYCYYCIHITQEWTKKKASSLVKKKLYSKKGSTSGKTKGKKQDDEFCYVRNTKDYIIVAIFSGLDVRLVCLLVVGLRNYIYKFGWTEDRPLDK